MSDDERISFGKRLGAYLLDFVLASILGAVLGMVAGASLAALFFPGGDMDMGPLTSWIGGAIGTVAGMALMIVVFMLIEGFTGATPGKMILGIKVKNADGSDAGMGSLLLRTVLKNISVVMPVLAGVTGVAILGQIGSYGGLAIFVGCFFVLGAKRQAFHDMIGKTAVYKK